MPDIFAVKYLAIFIINIYFSMIFVGDQAHESLFRCVTGLYDYFILNIPLVMALLYEYYFLSNLLLIYYYNIHYISNKYSYIVYLINGQYIPDLPINWYYFLVLFIYMKGYMVLFI